MPPITSSAPLGLTSVLVGSLPTALLTDLAPGRYTVEAVFTRRPLADEITRILDADTAKYLSDAGYPSVVLTVSDRRLEIAQTNLEELRDGLATTLATRLADISSAVKAQDDADAARSADIAGHELTRATAIARLAGTVAFTPADAFPRDHGDDPKPEDAHSGDAAEATR